MKLIWCAFDLNRDCNRNCTFCCNKPFLPERFTEETLKRAVEKIAQIVSKYGVENISVPILGGEPLLNPDLPLKLAHCLKKLTAHIDVWMYTNGDFITDEILAEYKANRIWITLSAAESPIDELIKKIEFLKKYYRIPRLSITLTRRNLLRLIGLVKKSIEIGFTIRFRNQYDCSNEPDLPRIYENIVPLALKYYASNPVLTLRNLVYTYEDVWPCWSDKKSPYTCGRSFLHFDPNGNIRACSGDPDSESIGSIFNDDDPIERLHEAVRDGRSGRWSAKNIPECQGCEVYNICQGGCPLSRKRAYGSFNKPSPYCRGMKKAIPIFNELCKQKEASC